MKKLIAALFIILLFAPAWSNAQAGSSNQPAPGGYSTNPATPFNYGTQEQTNLDGIGKSIFNGMMSLMSSFTFNNAVIKILDWVANVFVLTMKYFWTLVGSILIRNIDFSSSASYNNGLGFKTVSNLYTLFVTVGVCCSLSFFFLHIGQGAVGLGKMEIRFRSVIRLLVAISIIMIIPYFTSFMALWTNSLSQLIYQQNMMNMNGALDGISQMTADTFKSSTPTQPSAAPTDTLSFQNVHAGLLMILNYTYFFAFVGCIIGLIVGSYKVSSNAQNAYRILIGAFLGLIFIITAFELTRYFFSNGVAIFGGNPNQVSSVSAYNGSTFTVPNPAGSPDLNKDSGGFWGGVQEIFKSSATNEASSGLMLCAVIIKIFVSIYGCWIIAKVFFGKVFQLLTLAALFLLAPLLVATIAHPSMEAIGVAGLKYTVKYYLYSVVWAIALVFMFILTSINFGFDSMGAQNFETALAMLGGLIFVEKVEGLVGLLTGTGGPTVEGAMKDFGNFSSAVIGGATAAFGGAAGAMAGAQKSMGDSFGAHHMAGAIAGGAAGFLAPVLGAKQTASMAASAGIKFADSMGKHFSNSGSGSSSSNPYDAPGSSAEGGELASSLTNLTHTLQTRSAQRPAPNRGKDN